MTDMSQCTPSNAMSSFLEAGKWKLIPFETAQLTGTLAWAAQESNAPELRLPLKASGRYHIFVGCANLSGLGGYPLVKLSNDVAFTPLRRAAGDVEEVYFRTADLTAADQLVIAQRHKGTPEPAGVAWVRLTEAGPLDDAYTSQPLARHGVTGTIDGYTLFYERGLSTESELLEEIEPLRGTNLDTIILQSGGSGTTNFESRVTSDQLLMPRAVYPRAGDRIALEAIHELISHQVNPTSVLIKGAHNAGIRVLSGLRTGAWEYTEPFSDTMTSTFYRSHPEWHAIDRSGAAVSRMSYAVPEVRTYLVNMMRELVQQGSDGACLLFHRGPPFTGYEKPFLEFAKSKYGVDPLQAAPDDPRVLAARTECITNLMREMRTMLDELAAARQKHLTLAAITLSKESDNESNGIDITSLMKAHLLDEIYPDAFGSSTAVRDYITSITGLATPLGITVRPMNQHWNWSVPTADQLCRDASSIYSSGADGLCFWDIDLCKDSYLRQIALRLGDPKIAKTWASTSPSARRTYKFIRLGNYRNDLGIRQGGGF